MSRSFAFFMFSTYSGYKVGMAETSEFCFISHYIAPDYYLFTCQAKGPVSQEGYNVLFLHICTFSQCSGYNLGMAELGEFWFNSHHLVLDSQSFICHSHGPVRQEVCTMPFLHISMFSLHEGFRLGMAELGEPCFICHHLATDSYLVTCHWKEQVR